MTYRQHPLSAVDRARAAYEEMMRRQRDAAQLRQARDRTITIRWMISVGMLFALLLGVVIYNGWIPEGLRASMLGSDAAAKRFGATRTGQVRTMQGNTCKELNFSNDSGSYVSGNEVSCDTAIAKPAQPQSSVGSRANSIRDAFTR
jgi:hypothetical protein